MHALPQHTAMSAMRHTASAHPPHVPCLPMHSDHLSGSLVPQSTASKRLPPAGIGLRAVPAASCTSKREASHEQSNHERRLPSHRHPIASVMQGYEQRSPPGHAPIRHAYAPHTYASSHRDEPLCMACHGTQQCLQCDTHSRLAPNLFPALL